MAKLRSLEAVISFAQRNKVSIEGSTAQSGIFRLESIGRAIKANGRVNYLDPYYIVAITSAIEWDAKSKLHYALAHSELSPIQIKSLFGDTKFDIEVMLSIKKHEFGVPDIITSNLNISTTEQYIRAYEQAIEIVSGKEQTIRKLVSIYSDDSGVNTERFNAMVATLSKLFSKRHIIVHELPEGISGKSKNPFVPRTENFIYLPGSISCS